MVFLSAVSLLIMAITLSSVSFLKRTIKQPEDSTELFLDLLFISYKLIDFCGVV